MENPLGAAAGEFAHLSRGLDAAWDEARSGGLPDAIAGPLRIATDATRRIEIAATSLVADDRAMALERCAYAIDRLDERAREVLNDQRLDDAIVARGFALLKAEARLLRRVTRAIEGLAPLDENALRILELQDAENALRGRPEQEPRLARQNGISGEISSASTASATSQYAHSLASITADLREGRRELLRRQAMRRIEAAASIGASSPLTDETATAAFDVYRALDAAHRDLATRKDEFVGAAASDREKILETIESERARIEREFFAFAERVNSPAGLDVLRRAARSLEHELDEARMIGLEPATEPRVARLRHLQLVAERFLKTCRAALKQKNAPLTEELVRLEAMLKRVRHVVADRVLELRLERIFGKKTVRRWDSLVFWLILSVLLLLMIDHFRDPDGPGVIYWTTWADTAICGVLLLDFFTRMVVSPNPPRYVQRHFLTELIPALPFGLLANLETLHAVPTIGTVHVIEILTFLQALRPLIRIGRLFLFVSRATDRIVEQNAWLLNQNIVFFTDATSENDTPTLVKRTRELENFISRQGVAACALLPKSELVHAARLRLLSVAAESGSDRCEEPTAASRATVSVLDVEPNHLDVDDVIGLLRDLDASQVAEYVGVDVAQQITDSMRLFRLPWLRKMPVIRFVFNDTRVPDPLATTARLGRVCGDVLDYAQRAVLWFADLYGTITPSQFLDRIGAQIVKATARPARRLLLFGAIVGLVMALVRITRFEFLDRAAGFFIRFLSLPVLVLGVLCALPLALGTWFRRIARQAADFYDRVAEAQFLSLTEILKEETRDDDLAYLADRVVVPEAKLAGATAEAARDLALDFARRGSGLADGRGFSLSFEPTRFDIALLFYRDFLDGAYFHKNDTKVANLLLGNLTLENIRQNRLRFKKHDWKRLDRIDIARGKGGVAGASVWFSCITHSVAQNVARLILEYNRQCIPLTDLPSATNSERERFEHWLDDRERQSKALARGEAVLPTDSTSGIVEGALAYRTTEFNALHFLSANPRRDEAVRRRYGARVLRYVREDRENLVRVIFGTFPMRDLPRERRTFNPYEIYRRYFANGMLYLFPLRALALLFAGLKTLTREVIRIVREVRKPESRTTPRQSGHASFDVARRKIHRMRRPIAMEALRLRAEFDPEYLGLALPDRPSLVPHDQQFGEDLRTLNATEREWEQFRRLKSSRQEDLRRLAQLLRIAERRGKEAPFLHEDPARAGEAARAVAIAWICDHENAASRIAAHGKLSELLHRLEREKPPRHRLPRYYLGRGRVKALVDKAWPQLVQHGATASDDGLRERFVRALLTTDVQLRDELETLAARDHEGDIFDEAYAMLQRVATQPSAFTEQIIAVRAVHALAMLDLSGYERQVEGLGGYFGADAEMDSETAA